MTEVLANANHMGPAAECEVVLHPASGERQLAGFPKAVRGAVAERLASWGLSSFIEDAQLVASELATNAVQHAPDAPIRFVATYVAGVLRIEVTDGSPDDLTLRLPSVSEERGRGLQLVEHLVDMWGCDRNLDGTKTIWCSFLTHGDRL